MIFLFAWRVTLVVQEADVGPVIVLRWCGLLHGTNTETGLRIRGRHLAARSAIKWEQTLNEWRLKTLPHYFVAKAGGGD